MKPTSGRSPGSWVQAASLPTRFPAFPGMTAEWLRRETASHIQWRDRAGISPASLLCPDGHLKLESSKNRYLSKLTYGVKRCQRQDSARSAVCLHCSHGA